MASEIEVVDLMSLFFYLWNLKSWESETHMQNDPAALLRSEIGLIIDTFNLPEYNDEVQWKNDKKLLR